MATQSIDLQDPTVAPNPQIKALMDLGKELYELGEKAEQPIRGEYMAAYNRTVAAVERLMGIKNIMAGDAEA